MPLNCAGQSGQPSTSDVVEVVGEDGLELCDSATGTRRWLLKGYELLWSVSVNGGRSARGLTSYENLLAMRFDLEAIASKRLVVQVLSS